DGLVVLAGHRAGLNDLLPFLRAQRTDARRRWPHQCALDDGRNALFFEGRGERFPRAKIGDRLERVEVRVRTERVGRGLDRVRFPRSIGAQGVLYTIAELRQNGFGNVERILRDEIDAYSLVAD